MLKKNFNKPFQFKTFLHNKAARQLFKIPDKKKVREPPSKNYSDKSVKFANNEIPQGKVHLEQANIAKLLQVSSG